MNTLIGGLAGAFGGFGLFLLIQGWRGALTSPIPNTATTGGAFGRGGVEGLNRRIGVAVTIGVLAWFATGWPVGTALAMAAGWWGPGIVGDRRKRATQIAKTEAIASWTEQLRDVVSAAAGIGEALVSTARVAPAAIRPDVEDLARRLRREDPDTALAAFAAAVDDPTADQVVVALRLSMAERGERLSEILSAIAEAAREQASAARNIEASRSNLWRQAATVTIVMFSVFGILLSFQRDYLDAYNTLTGQITIGVIGVLWGTSLRMMVRLAQGTDQPRILNAGTTRRSGPVVPVGEGRR